MGKDILRWKLPEKPECFFGREEELQKINELFDAGNHVIFLQGIGGIGKSELAAQYAMLNLDKYDVVVFSNCINDIQTMVASDKEVPFENMKRNTLDEYFLETEEDYFERKFELLQEVVTEQTLLIVDNYNCENDEHLDLFLELKCKILFTTRVNWEVKHFPVILLEEIKAEDSLQKIFEHYYLPQNDAERLEIQKIISLTGGYTLAIEWIAKQLTEQNVTMDEMISVLEKNKSDDSKGILAKLLSDVFKVNDLSEEEKSVLRFLCFVPYTGVSKEELVRRGKRGTHTAVLKLLRSSWMKQIELDVVTLHPVVAETVAAELKPSWENMEYYLNSIVQDLLDDDLPIQEIEYLLVVSEKMFRMLGMQNYGALSLLIAVGHVFFERYRKYDLAIGMLQHALTLQEKMMDHIRVKISLCKEQTAADPEYESLKSQLMDAEVQKSKIIQQIGEIYFLAEQYEKALEWYMKLSRSPVVDIYCDIAKVYAKVNECKKAMEYIQAGIKMKRNKNGDNEVPLVESYLLMASIYIQMQDFHMAKEWLKEAERIADTQMSQEEQSDFYYEYALILKKMENNEEALLFDQKAYTLRMKLYGENHLAVIRSYAAMAVDYYRLQDYVSALECTLREIECRKKIRRVKRRLYMSVSRLVGFVVVENLPEDTQEKLKVFMRDFNRILKENPKEAQEMLKQ